MSLLFDDRPKANRPSYRMVLFDEMSFVLRSFRITKSALLPLTGPNTIQADIGFSTTYMPSCTWIDRRERNRSKKYRTSRAGHQCEEYQCIHERRLNAETDARLQASIIDCGSKKIAIPDWNPWIM